MPVNGAPVGRSSNYPDWIVTGPATATERSRYRHLGTTGPPLVSYPTLSRSWEQVRPTSTPPMGPVVVGIQLCDERPPTDEQNRLWDGCAATICRRVVVDGRFPPEAVTGCP